MRLGTLLERAVLDWASQDLGKLRRNCERVVAGVPLGSHIDAITANGDPVEAKTSGLLGPTRERWGDEGTDDVPERVIIQSHVHMLATGRQRCYVPALLGGRGFVMFVVPFSNELGDALVRTAVAFWTDHVLSVIPPTGQAPTLEALERRNRVPDKIVAVPPKVLEQYGAWQKYHKNVGEVVDALKAQLLASLGDAEMGDGGDAGSFTYLEYERRSIDTKALRKAEPETAERYERVTKYRMLKLRLPEKENDDGGNRTGQIAGQPARYALGPPDGPFDPGRAPEALDAGSAGKDGAGGGVKDPTAV